MEAGDVLDLDTTPPGDDFERIDAYVEQEMERLKIPGLALAIVEGNEIAHLRGFGRARPRGEAPTPRTPFCIGSLTKSVTALAVMQLVEAGKVDPSSPHCGGCAAGASVLGADRAVQAIGSFTSCFR